jgi:hypothetical protein
MSIQVQNHQKFWLIATSTERKSQSPVWLYPGPGYDSRGPTTGGRQIPSRAPRFTSQSAPVSVTSAPCPGGPTARWRDSIGRRLDRTGISFLRFTPCGLFEFAMDCTSVLLYYLEWFWFWKSEHTCSTHWQVGWFLAWTSQVRRRSLPFLLSISWYQTINALVWTIKEDEPLFFFFFLTLRTTVLAQADVLLSIK